MDQYFTEKKSVKHNNSQNTMGFIEINAFHKIIYKIPAILFKPLWIELYWEVVFILDTYMEINDNHQYH